MGAITRQVPLPPAETFARVKAGIQAKFPKESAGAKWDDAALTGLIADSRASVDIAVKSDPAGPSTGLGQGSLVEVAIGGPFGFMAEAMLKPKILSFLDGLAKS